MNEKLNRITTIIGLALKACAFAIAHTSCSTPPASTLLSVETEPVASEISKNTAQLVSHALVIANEDYNPPIDTIATAKTDAESLKLTLSEYVHNVDVKVIYDLSNRGDIELEIQRFVKKINKTKEPLGFLIFAYSGHAELEANGSQSLIMINGDHYPLSELIKNLASHNFAQSTKHILLLNCCRNEGAASKKWSYGNFLRRNSAKKEGADIGQVFRRDMQVNNFLVSFPVRKGSKTDIGEVDYASIGNSTLAEKKTSPYIASFCSALMDSPGKSDLAVLDTAHKTVRGIKFPAGRPNTFNPELVNGGDEPILQTGLITPKSYEEWRTDGNVDIDPVTKRSIKRDVRLQNLRIAFSELPGLNFEPHKIEIPQRELNCPMRFLDHTLDGLAVIVERARTSETQISGFQILDQLEGELNRRLAPYGLKTKLSRDEVVELAELVLQGFRPWINSILKLPASPSDSSNG